MAEFYAQVDIVSLDTSVLCLEKEPQENRFINSLPLPF